MDNFVSQEEEEIMEHIPTKWLILYSAVERNLKCFAGYINYCYVWTAKLIFFFFPEKLT